MTDNAKELLALADRIAKSEAIEIVDADMIDRNFDPRERCLIVSALRLSARQQASVESLVELIAKHWYWDMHSIMHDHDENWRKFEKRELYLSVARYVIRALLAKYDIFQKVEG